MTWNDLCIAIYEFKQTDYHTYVMINVNYLRVKNYIFYKNGKIEECKHHQIIAKDMSYNQMFVKINNLFGGEHHNG